MNWTHELTSYNVYVCCKTVLNDETVGKESHVVYAPYRTIAQFQWNDRNEYG